MNREEKHLRIQALVDGELTRSEAESLTVELEKDAELNALYLSLGRIRDAVAECGELEHPLPVKPDFYWKKVFPLKI